MLLSKSAKRYYFGIHTFLIILTFCMIFPLVLLFICSISSEKSLLVYGYSFLPREFSLEAYSYIWKNSSVIFSAYGMTILVTTVGTTINVFLTILLAYPLSVRTLPFRKFFSFYVFFTMLFNGGLVPSYIMWTTIFQIRNTIWAYILPGYLLGAMNVILMRTFFMHGIPEALFEAAHIDGANHLQIMWKIVIPLGKPIIVTVAMFSGLFYWNDWTNGLYYVSKPKLYTIQVLLNRMIQDIQALQANTSSAVSAGAIMSVPTVSIRMAIAFVALIPILIIYPFLQKYFAEGIMLGAVKG